MTIASTLSSLSRSPSFEERADILEFESARQGPGFFGLIG